MYILASLSCLANDRLRSEYERQQLTDNEQELKTMSALNNSSAPDFAGGNEAVLQQEIMEFHQDGAVEDARPVDTAVVPVQESSASDLVENSVIGFLQRPLQVAQFDWLSSTGDLGNLVTLHLPRDWLTQNMIKEKVAGFRYLRCDLVVEVQINAQPFNAGMAVLWFNPLGEQMGTQPSSTAHLGGITGYPCAYYRCGESTAVRLRIPYQAVQSHFDLVKGTGTMGTVSFTIMSPLTGASDVDGTVWVWAENVSIQMPTGIPPRFSGTAQGGVKAASKGDATKAERTKRGPVESALNIANDVASVAGMIPGLGAVAGVGQTLFSAGSAVASFFGWSKPINSEQVAHFRQMFGKHMTNATGSADVKIMSLDARNTVDIPTEIFGTSDDEMAFGHLLKRPTFMDRFTFSSTQTQGTLLWKWPVHPQACVKTRGTSGSVTFTQFQPSLLAYVSQCADRWRGSICYEIAVVKTPFHSGRVRVTFVPGADEATDFNSIDLAKCYSAVHDLREESNIDFCVPYVSNVPFQTCVTDPIPSPRPVSISYGVPTGMIYISIVNALRAPSTAASSIEFIVFEKAGDDFQLAYPQIDPRLRMMTSASNVVPVSFSGPAQSGFIKSTSPVNFDANKIAMGESFTGFRQWLKRNTHRDIIAGSNPGTFIINPFAHPQNWIAAGTFLQDNALQLDSFMFSSVLYRYLSGPMRMLINNKTAEGVEVTIGLDSTQFPTTQLIADGRPWSISTSLEPITEFEVPFYSFVPALPTRVGVPQDAIGYQVNPGPLYSCVPSNSGTVIQFGELPSPVESFLSIGETFSFGFQIGPPVIFMAD